MFPIPESYKIRHLILKYLFELSEKEVDSQRPKNKISLQQISNELKKDFTKIKFYHESLHEEGEINCEYDCINAPDEHYLLITSKGRQSYIYEKYLKSGSKEAKDNIKDIISICSPVVAVIISILSLIISVINYQNTIKTTSQQKKSNNKINKKEIQIKSPIRIPNPKNAVFTL